jgi:hypothetical protein
MAAALMAQGDATRARRELQRSGIELSRRRWMRQAWPWYWDLLVRIEPQAPHRAS